MPSRPPRNDRWLPYLVVGGCAMLALSIAAVGTFTLLQLKRDSPPDQLFETREVTQASLISAPTPDNSATPSTPHAAIQPTTLALVPSTPAATQPRAAESGSQEPSPRVGAAAAEPTRSAAAGRAGPTSYTVVSGDTLSSIAARFGVSVQTIMDANELTNPERLRVGQELYIPAADGIVHTVKAGETVLRLSQLYGVSVEEISRANGLDDDYSIRVGQKLLIPGATRRVTTPTATQARPTATPTRPAATAAPARPPSPTVAPTQPRASATATRSASNTP